MEEELPAEERLPEEREAVLPEEREAPDEAREALEEERAVPEAERAEDWFAREPEALERTADPERLWLERDTLVRPLREAEAERTAAALRLPPVAWVAVAVAVRPTRRAVVDSLPIGV